MAAISSQGVHMILCCQCGVQIEPNPANMCVACLRSEVDITEGIPKQAVIYFCRKCERSEVDITEGIPKQAVIYFCRKCERYLQPPDQWTMAQLESRELLAVCLKRLKGLNKVRLVDAGFVWTEPHSQRIKVKLTVQKEVMNGAIIQQVFVVEFVVNNQQCDDCHRVEAKDFWRAIVQIRQKTDHKKTLFYLEQMIIKHKAHTKTVNIKPCHEGLDFYFVKKDDAKKMTEYLNTVVPCKIQAAQELISHDVRNNTFNYKHTYSVNIVPVCKDNIVCLPPKLAASLGNINPICLCYKVTQTVHLIDPNTLQLADVSSQAYWRSPFVSLCSPKQLIQYMVMQVEYVQDRDKPVIKGQVSNKLIQYMVMQVEYVQDKDKPIIKGQVSNKLIQYMMMQVEYVQDKDKPVIKGQVSNKHVLADLWVAKMSDLGVNDRQYFCRTHIGHLLSEGDTVLGFDLGNANINNQFLEKIKAEKIPDVVIVKKYYEKRKRNRNRKWKLQHLNDELHNLETDSAMQEYTDFLEDLEEDPTLRQNVNIYKDSSRIAVDIDDTDDEGAPQISLQEMLEDLQISGDATGGEGDAMMD